MRIVEALSAAGIDMTSEIIPDNSPFKTAHMCPKARIDVIRDTRDGALYRLEPFGGFNPEMVPVDQKWLNSQVDPESRAEEASMIGAGA